MKFWLYRADVKASPYLYIAPFFLLFGALGAFPLAYTAWVAMHDWSLLADEHPFIGLDNFTELLKDTFFWNALGNTASIWVLSTVPQLVFALLLAHTLNNRLRTPTFWRTGHAAAEHHQRGGRVGHLQPALRPRLRPDQLGASACSAWTRSTGTPARSARRSRSRR